MKKDKEIKEPFFFKIKNEWIRSKPITILLILTLVLLFLLLNLGISNLDLPHIDVTENKIYTLSDLSKVQLQDIEKEIKIYAYGYDEKTSVVDLLKQYSKANPNIKYEILTEETNKGKVDEYELTPGYSVVVVEVGDSSTILDGNNEFSSYDYLTGQEVDLTEQKITNAILHLAVDKRPKVYILSGHGEYQTNELGVITTYLGNEAFEYDELKLLNEGKVPADCNTLLILSPTSDLLESETDAIIEYINRGGDIIYTKDTEKNGKTYPNLQKILDCYGLEVVNGYVYETETEASAAGYPNIVMPTINLTDITSDIYSDGGYLVFYYAEKVKTADEETASSLGVTYETLLQSSESSKYISDVSENIKNAYLTAEDGSVNLAVLATKTVGTFGEVYENAEPADEEDSDTKEILSKCIVIGCGNFCSDNLIPAISQTYPLSYIGNNKDFMLNSISYLSDREDKLTIRKQINTSTYLPTEKQDLIVKSIIFGVPILIILVGIIVWNRRKRKR